MADKPILKISFIGTGTRVRCDLFRCANELDESVLGMILADAMRMACQYKELDLKTTLAHLCSEVEGPTTEIFETNLSGKPVLKLVE